MHPKYQQLIEFVFDHEVQDPYWDFDLSDFEGVSNEDIVAL